MLNHGLHDYNCEDFINVGTPKSTSLAHHPVGEEFETMRDGESEKRYNSLKMPLQIKLKMQLANAQITLY